MKVDRCDFCGEEKKVFVAENVGTGAKICEGCADDAISAFITAKHEEDDGEDDDDDDG